MNEVCPVVKINVVGAFRVIEFLGFTGTPTGVFTEFPGMGLVAGDEQQRALDGVGLAYVSDFMATPCLVEEL